MTYADLSRSLKPVLGERTEEVLQEGLRRLQLRPEALDPEGIELLLKRIVYRELQARYPIPEARTIVSQILSQLKGNDVGLSQLEAGLKRFQLYLDWPEVGRLRSIINALRAQPQGELAQELLKEGRALLTQLERKLQEALLRQSRDLSDLEAAWLKVKHIGGPKVRRFETLLHQIQEAHAQETLAPAEVERARSLAVELRKLVESSVVQAPTLVEEPVPALDLPAEAPEDFEVEIDLEGLSEEQQSKIREIDRAEERRRLEALKIQYQDFLTPELNETFERLFQRLESGELLGDELETFEASLKAREQEAFTEARVRYEWMAERLRQLEAELKEEAAPLSARLNLALETLQMGALPKDFESLEALLSDLERRQKERKAAEERRAQLQRELAQLRQEAEQALSLYHHQPGVAQFLNTLPEQIDDEKALQELKERLSQLLVQLAQAQKEQKLQQASLKAALAALPIELLGPEGAALARQRDQLLSKLNTEQPPLTQLRGAIEALSREVREAMSRQLTQLAHQAAQWNVSLEGLTEARKLLEQGGVPDLRGLETRLREAVSRRQQALLDELTRLEEQAQALRGLGGEGLLEGLSLAKARLRAGEPIELTPFAQDLSHLQSQLGLLRNSLRGRIEALEAAFPRYQNPGGDTVNQLRPRIKFLAEAKGKLEQLGAQGLLELRSSLEEAEQLFRQLEEEHQAAQQVLSELKGADLESLLEIFETPASDPFASFRFRGVEQASWIDEPGLPKAAIQGLLEDLKVLGQELQTSQLPKLAVITWANEVLILVPQGQRVAFFLSQRSLLSRLLGQIEKERVSWGG
jgi:chromosome segregation protein